MEFGLAKSFIEAFGTSSQPALPLTVCSVAHI